MNKICVFLGKKTKMYYCRKQPKKPCPSGYISSCPAIPKEFWNIDTIMGKEEHNSPQQTLDKSENEIVHSVAAKKESIRTISIFKK